MELHEGKEGERDLDPTVATIDEIAVEEVGPLGGWQAVRAEDVHQVLELAVQVTDDGKSGALTDSVVSHVRAATQQLGLASEKSLRDASPAHVCRSAGGFAWRRVDSRGAAASHACHA